MLDGAKKHFVFGYMRLPMNGDEVDIEQTKQMVDYFLENGFNYFDTAHGYLEGKSEKAIKTCLADRGRACSSKESLRYHPQQKPDSMYSLQILHRRLPETHFHPGSLCLHEHQTDLS